MISVLFLLHRQIYISSMMFPLCPLLKYEDRTGSRWRLILAVDYQFSTNLVPLVAAPAFVPLITPWLPLSPPAGYIRSALHITTRYISTIVHELTSLIQRHVPFLLLTINFFLFHRFNGERDNFRNNFFNDDGRASNKSRVFSNYRGQFNHTVFS